MLRNLKSFNQQELEEKVLKLWEEKNIFERTLKIKKGQKSKQYNFWEGPPSANGRPGIHHILSRVFKDVFARYATMSGFLVSRKAGWDTHGLPVEIETEKSLGIKSKKEIEKYGIKEFNQKALEIVWKYKDEWEKITKRIGYWLDMKNPYITYSPEYIESLWWVFGQLSQKGFLKEFYKVTPYCPRCQTGLASHELAQPGVYKNVSDPSLYIKFPIKNKKNEYLLVWTTTPWTLSANTAIAVLKDAWYKKFKVKDEYFWSLFLPEKFLKEGISQVVETISGDKLIGLEYEPLFRYPHKISLPIKMYSVIGADFISDQEGTGLVHIAPTFGEDDFDLIFKNQNNLSDYQIPETVNLDGLIKKGFIGENLFVKEADDLIIEALNKRNLIFYLEKIEHEYPFCWRCSTPLLYLARKSWFFEVSKIRQKLLDANSSVNWIPAHIKDGRFGEWLSQAKDWAISRQRYWGTPLPIWQCEECGENNIVSSLEDLNQKRVHKNKYFIIRHGETTSILEGWIGSGKEVGRFISRMTPKGIKQIEKSAKELAKKKISIIYASPYSRIKEVVSILQKYINVKVVFDDRLKEIDCGIWNHKNILEFRQSFSHIKERFDNPPEGGESLNDVRKRVYSFIQEIDSRHNDENIIIAGHGDPLWMLESAVKHFCPEEALSLPYISVGTWRELCLDNYPTNDFGNIDIHRPFVDKVKIQCQKCGKIAKRVNDVIDVWFDSGAMPYAQDHFPFGDKNKKSKKNPNSFPANFICEGVDQTRGWFYTLMVISVMLTQKAPYKNVMSLGLIMDKFGQKMSKSKDNVIDPWSVINKYGVDPIRWYFYTLNDPGESKNFDEEEIKKVTRRFLMTIYNSFVFLQMYGKDKLDISHTPGSKDILDRWIISRLSKLSYEVKNSMDAYDIVLSCRKIEEFVDDLSRWYIRRSRRRLQKPEDSRTGKKDYENVSKTLAVALYQLSIIIAPFVPFFSESLYQSIKKSYKFQSKDSVHLESWPEVDRSNINSEIESVMQEVRDISSLVLAKRAEVQIKVRQPLLSLMLKNTKLKNKKFSGILDIIKKEVNVKEIIFDNKIEESFILDTNITSELKIEGVVREFMRIIQDLRQTSNLVPRDIIMVSVDCSGDFKNIISQDIENLQKEVGAKRIDFSKTSKFDIELETKIDIHKIWISIRKI